MIHLPTPPSSWVADRSKRENGSSRTARSRRPLSAPAFLTASMMPVTHPPPERLLCTGVLILYVYVIMTQTNISSIFWGVSLSGVAKLPIGLAAVRQPYRARPVGRVTRAKGFDTPQPIRCRRAGSLTDFRQMPPPPFQQLEASVRQPQPSGERQDGVGQQGVVKQIRNWQNPLGGLYRTTVGGPATVPHVPWIPHHARDRIDETCYAQEDVRWG
jgi:hypothetical protein